MNIFDIKRLNRYLADVQDEGTVIPPNHDPRYHPDGFNPETDTCGLRDKIDAENRAADPEIDPGAKPIKPYTPYKTKKSVTTNAIAERRRKAMASPEELELLRERNRLAVKKSVLRKEGKELTEEEARRLKEVRDLLNRNKDRGEPRDITLVRRANKGKLAAACTPEEAELRRRLEAVDKARRRYALYPDKVEALEAEVASLKERIAKLAAERRLKAGKPVNKYPSRPNVLDSSHMKHLKNKLCTVRIRLNELRKKAGDAFVGSGLSSEDRLEVQRLEKAFNELTEKIRAQKQKDDETLNERERRGIVERRTYSEKGYDYTVQWKDGAWRLVETNAPEEVLNAKRAKGLEATRKYNARKAQGGPVDILSMLGDAEDSAAARCLRTVSGGEKNDRVSDVEYLDSVLERVDDTMNALGIPDEDDSE